MFSIFPEVDNWGLKKSERIIKDSAEGIFFSDLAASKDAPFVYPFMCDMQCYYIASQITTWLKTIW